MALAQRGAGVLRGVDEPRAGRARRAPLEEGVVVGDITARLTSRRESSGAEAASRPTPACPSRAQHPRPGLHDGAGEGAAAHRRDPRNADVLFPYLNGAGSQLATRIRAASRWVINFHDWPEERARTYRDCYRPGASGWSSRSGSSKTTRRRREHWWRFADYRRSCTSASPGLQRVIVITLVSKTVMPVLVPTGQVFSHMLGVFATDDTAMLALLSSAPHYWWAVTYASIA